MISYKDIIIAVEEYNKILYQNQKLARDHAGIKSQLAQYKDALRKYNTENMELKQQLSVANNEVKRLELEIQKHPDINQITDRVKHTISLLTEEYLAIDGMKHQINEFGNKMDTIKGVMSSLLSVTENNGQTSELNDIDFFGVSMSNSSVRLSMSSQERDYKRRASSEMIRRDFQVLTELSTILEMSCENRMSSLGGNIENDITKGRPSLTRVIDSMDSAGNGSNACTSSATQVTKIVANARKSKRVVNKSTKSKKETKLQKEPTVQKEAKTKTTTKKSKEALNKVDNKKNSTKACEKSNEPKPKADVYDFSEEDKENVVPETPVIRHSRQTRSRKQFMFP